MDATASAAIEAAARNLIAGGPEAMRAALEEIFNMAMQIEREQFVGARRCQRSPTRRCYANGYKPKRVDTVMGTLRLRVPKTAGHGDTPFYPASLERGRRCHRALMDAAAQMYVCGVSTRRVRGLLRRMGVEGLSSSQVSRAAKLLDETLEAWRSRPLGRVRYLQIDARYEKVRMGGRVRSAAVLTAIGVGEDGRRRVLGVAVAESEAEAHWRGFLESLAERGMRGVEIVASDDHAGLRAACKAALPGAAWQRCQFHLARSAAGHAPSLRIRRRIGAALRRVWNAPDRAAAQAALARLAASARRSHPGFADWLETSVPEGLAVFDLPEGHRRAMRTTNSMERAIQQELKRRTRVAGVFPNPESLLRLASAVLARIDAQWAAADPCLRWERRPARPAPAQDERSARGARRRLRRSAPCLRQIAAPESAFSGDSSLEKGPTMAHGRNRRRVGLGERVPASAQKD